MMTVKELIKKSKNPYPCDSCLVGWCAISNQGTKSCQDTCIRWKEYWKKFTIKTIGCEKI